MGRVSSLLWASICCLFVAASHHSGEYARDFCPNVTVIRDFNATAYLGTWYEVRRYPARFEKAASCVSSQYSLKDDGNITILARMFNTTTKKYVTMEGMLRRANGDTPEGKLLVAFTTSKAEGNFWLLGTDYTSYSVVWWCRENEDGDYSLYSWIMSRTKKLQTEAELGIKKVLADNGLSFDDIYLVTKQENCPTENGDI